MALPASPDRPPIAFDQSPPFVSPLAFGRGMAVIRIFFGLILFANGLAKIDARLGQIDLGPYHANLVTLGEARGILNFEVNQRQIRPGAPKGTQLTWLRPFVNDVVLAHWDIFKWGVVAIEVGAGALLMLGVATRGAALVDLGEMLFLALVYLSSNRWAFEQPHDYLPLIVLAIVPAGSVWGIDGWLIRRGVVSPRWPF